MKIAILILCLMCATVRADDSPVEPPKQQPRMYFECGTMRGAGVLVIVDEHGQKQFIAVGCGTRV